MFEICSNKKVGLGDNYGYLQVLLGYINYKNKK